MTQLSHFVQLLEQQVFFAAAILLIAGFLFSRLAKLVKLPRVTGYIIAGILLGPSIMKVFTHPALAQMEFMPQFALGIIAMVIGAGLSFDLIKRLGIKLLLITLCESLGAFFLVMFLLSWLKMPLEAVLPLAAIAAATAPAATVAVIREFRANGPFTETTMAVVALDDAVAITLFGVVMTLDLKNLSGFGETAMHSISRSLFEIMLALIIGLALAILAHLLIKLTKEMSDALIVIIGVVLLGVTLATVLGVSHLLTNMFLGMILINISNKNAEIVTGLERMAPPIYVFFFVLAGAHLDLEVFFNSGPTFIIWGLAFVAARLIGKISGAYLGGTISRAPDAIRKYLGLALAPEAGVAIGLTLLISKTSGFYDFRSIILNITLMAVAVNELIGPVLTKIALFRAGEASKEE